MAKTGKTIEIPSNIRGDFRKFYRDVMELYDLEPHHIRLLVVACEELQRADTAQKVLDSEGMSVEGREGPKPRTELLARERAVRNALAAIKALGFDIEPPGPIGRPPGG